MIIKSYNQCHYILSVKLVYYVVHLIAVSTAEPTLQNHRSKQAMLLLRRSWTCHRLLLMQNPVTSSKYPSVLIAYDVPEGTDTKGLET